VDDKGTHLLMDFYGAPAAILDDASALEEIARQVADRIGARILDRSCHKLAPQGVILVLTLRQSHISIHTWPEDGYAAVDLFFCARDFHEGASLPEWIGERLGAARFEEWILSRGKGLSGPSAVTSRHGP
jgi:S-adenosylmethionine decarboxylase